MRESATISDITGIKPYNVFLSIVCGALLTAGFPLVGWSWAPWIGFVFLFWAISDLDARRSFFIGLIAGLAHYLSLLYWLIETMKVYGYLPLWLSVVILILLALYMSLYMAVFSSLVSGVCRSPAVSVFMIPVFWVCLEYLRTVLFTGFPWGLIGYSQYRFFKLIQISDIFGVYGLSFLVVFANSVIFFILLRITDSKWHTKKVGNRQVMISAMVLALLVSWAFIYGQERLNAVDQMISKAEKVNISVIQGNIAQPEKWDLAFRDKTIDTYIRLSEGQMKNHPDLIVWPETAVPFYFGYDVGLTDYVIDSIKSMETYFLIGAPTVEFGKNDRYYNSAYLINPEGKTIGRYDKVHLVPFGEYVPLRKFLPFLGKIVEQVGDFNAGKIGNTLKWDGANIGMLICYEVIFPHLSMEMARNHANILINITNDAWFGNTSAPYQHFSMAVFRAIETRRSLVRAANTGISGFIDPTGRVIAQTGLYREAAMTRKVPIIKNYQTVYTRYGDVLVWACFIASIIYFMIIFIIKFFPKGKN